MHQNGQQDIILNSSSKFIQIHFLRTLKGPLKLRIPVLHVPAGRLRTARGEFVATRTSRLFHHAKTKFREVTCEASMLAPIQLPGSGVTNRSSVSKRETLLARHSHHSVFDQMKMAASVIKVSSWNRQLLRLKVRGAARINVAKAPYAACCPIPPLFIIICLFSQLPRFCLCSLGSLSRFSLGSPSVLPRFSGWDMKRHHGVYGVLPGDRPRDPEPHHSGRQLRHLAAGLPHLLHPVRLPGQRPH